MTKPNARARPLAEVSRQRARLAKAQADIAEMKSARQRGPCSTLAPSISLVALKVHTMVPAETSKRHFGRFIAYYRVSTDRQGKSGLGLDAR